MRVGIYVDAFNVYYGVRGIVEPATAGWKWLDLVGLSQTIVSPDVWPEPRIVRLTYCSAPRSRTGDPVASGDQQAYFDALAARCRQLGVQFEMPLGIYRARSKSGMLLRERRPQKVPWADVQLDMPLPRWLDGVRSKQDVDGVHYAYGSVGTFEEKGSDVNLATALSWDVAKGAIDAAIVWSNDSDLALPVSRAREVCPVGLVNPTRRFLSHSLSGSATAGAGRHWWHHIMADEVFSHQLPESLSGTSRPADW